MKGTAAAALIGLAVACQGGETKEQKTEPPPATETAPTEKKPAAGPKRALLVAEDGYWVAVEGKAPKKVARDAAALSTELALVQSRQAGTQLDLAAEDAVPYQEIIVAMDKAIASGMSDVALVNATSLPVPLPPAGAQLPTRCNDNAAAAARPAGGAATPPIATLPVVVVMKDGSGYFAGSDGVKTEFAAPVGCEMNIPAMVEWLKAGGHKTLILQADRDATAGMIHRVVRSATAAGAGNVLFAVSRG